MYKVHVIVCLYFYSSFGNCKTVQETLAEVEKIGANNGKSEVVTKKTSGMISYVLKNPAMHVLRKVLL